MAILHSFRLRVCNVGRHAYPSLASTAVVAAAHTYVRVRSQSQLGDDGRRAALTICRSRRELGYACQCKAGGNLDSLRECFDQFLRWIISGQQHCNSGDDDVRLVCNGITVVVFLCIYRRSDMHAPFSFDFDRKQVSCNC